MSRIRIAKPHCLPGARIFRIASNVIHAHQTRADEPLPADFAEQNLTRLNDEVVDSLESQLRSEIARIDHALQRIEAGVGEVCEKCGAPITGARLEALPYSTLCVQCAQ